MQQSIKRRVLRRLKILEGQVRGLQRLVDEETYCVDVLRQTSAVKQALSSIEDLMLENHLATHVAEQMKKGKANQAKKEVLAVYKLSKQK